MRMYSCGCVLGGGELVEACPRGREIDLRFDELLEETTTRVGANVVLGVFRAAKELGWHLGPRNFYEVSEENYYGEGVTA